MPSDSDEMPALHQVLFSGFSAGLLHLANNLDDPEVAAQFAEMIAHMNREGAIVLGTALADAVDKMDGIPLSGDNEEPTPVLTLISTPKDSDDADR